MNEHQDIVETALRKAINEGYGKIPTHIIMHPDFAYSFFDELMRKYNFCSVKNPSRICFYKEYKIYRSTDVEPKEVIIGF